MTLQMDTNPDRPKEAQEQPADQLEEAFWFDFWSRHEGVSSRLEQWRADTSVHRETRTKLEGEQQKLLDGMNSLARADATSDENKRLKHWYAQATKTEREIWARGDGPNTPGRRCYSERELERARKEYERIKSSKERLSASAIARSAGMDRGKVTAMARAGDLPSDAVQRAPKRNRRTPQ